MSNAICVECGEEVEADICACGQPRSIHDIQWLGHDFIPLGCACHTPVPPPDPEPERCLLCGYPPDACGCPRCHSCGNVIDPDYCHCGSRPNAHGLGGEEHSFVPMGCTCHYAPRQPTSTPFRVGPLPWDGPAIGGEKP